MIKDLENKILEVAELVYNTGYTAGSAETGPIGYDNGYKYGNKIGYDQGLNDAWECARKMYQFNPSTNEQLCEELYDMRFNEFICTVSASEAVEKIKEFEKKGTCNKCVRSNTCVHKHEDIICFGCVNGSEYEEEPKLTEKRCIECRHHSDTHGHCLFKIDGGRCVNRDHWEPKQPEKRCEDCKNFFTAGYSTVCLIKKAACCVNKDKWVPKQTEQTEQIEKQPKQSCEDCINENTCSLKCPEHVRANGCRSWAPKQTNDQIKLGDEVIHTTGSKGIVVGMGNGTLYLLMHDYDMPQKVSKEGYTKTGRYFPQIQELRDQLH